MTPTAKRRLALLGGGALLAATVAALARITLPERGVAAEAYAVAVGLGVAMPVILAGAYPTRGWEGTGRVDRRRPTALLVAAESVAGVVVGVGAVALLLAIDLPALLPVGGGAAAAFVGAVSARALVLGRATTVERE